MDKKTFALNAIKPYFDDPSICGIENGTCSYLTSNNKKCVAGKFMKEPEKFDGEIRGLIMRHGETELFRPEAVGVLSLKEWQDLQSVHDTIAKKKLIPENLSELITLFTYQELKDHVYTISEQ